MTSRHIYLLNSKKPRLGYYNKDGASWPGRDPLLFAIPVIYSPITWRTAGDISVKRVRIPRKSPYYGLRFPRAGQSRMCTGGDMIYHQQLLQYLAIPSSASGMVWFGILLMYESTPLRRRRS